MITSITGVFSNIGEWFGNLKTKISDKIEAIKEYFMGILDKFNPFNWFGDKDTDKASDDAKRKRDEAKAEEKRLEDEAKAEKKRKSDEVKAAKKKRERDERIERVESGEGSWREKRRYEKDKKASDADKQKETIAERSSAPPNIPPPTPASEESKSMKEMDETNKRMEESINKLAEIMVSNGQASEALLSNIAEKPVAVTPPASVNTGGMQVGGDSAHIQRRSHMSNGGM